jgi:hypothetical protein
MTRRTGTNATKQLAHQHKPRPPGHPAGLPACRPATLLADHHCPACWPITEPQSPPGNR